MADTLKISEDSVFIILHESLGMRKLFSKWVPRLLTPDQKQQRVKHSERCGKVMASVFWDAHGILFIDYLEEGNSILCA